MLVRELWIIMFLVLWRMLKYMHQSTKHLKRVQTPALQRSNPRVTVFKPHVTESFILRFARITKEKMVRLCANIGADGMVHTSWLRKYQIRSLKLPNIFSSLNASLIHLLINNTFTDLIKFLLSLDRFAEFCIAESQLDRQGAISNLLC